MKDRDIAIAHMTIWDADTQEDASMWAAHWDKHIDEMSASEHSGDCTKQPWSCNKCITDEAYRMVPIYRKMFNI
jgi:hypothetical protein